MKSNLKVGDILSPIYFNPNAGIGWKSSKYLLVKKFESYTWDDESIRTVSFVNEAGNEIEEQYAFIESLINEDVLKIIEDDIERAKILLSY